MILCVSVLRDTYLTKVTYIFAYVSKFYVFMFYIKPMIHFEFVFVYSMRCMYKLSFAISLVLFVKRIILFPHRIDFLLY